jgi:hypothetical protein
MGEAGSYYMAAPYTIVATTIVNSFLGVNIST